MLKTTDILLATYNGAPFLQQQLNSILEQSYTDWHIIARDDGSTDNTIEILNDFQKTHPEKITLVSDALGRLGHARKSFAHLLTHSTSDYISFCDQDDIWQKDKIQSSIKNIQHVEDTQGTDTPTLSHHDYTHIDESNNLIKVPALKYHEQGTYIPFSGGIRGFCMTFNKALKGQVNINTMMQTPHDTYLTFLAKELGQIVFTDKEQALYRRHGANLSTADTFKHRTLKRIFSQSVSQIHVAKELKKMIDDTRFVMNIKQDIAKEFLKAHGHQITPKTKKLLDEFSHMEELSLTKRKAMLFKYASHSTSRKIIAALTL